MPDHTKSEPPIEQLFAQSVVDGSARYWAAHFSRSQRQSGVKAALCFAHLMDELTAVSPEVIAEKSVWWHEELTDCSLETAQHPITLALLQSRGDLSKQSLSPGLTPSAIVDAMHRHLHGALMSQQHIGIDTMEDWTQYTQLRFGTLHELIGIASGMPHDAAAHFGVWAANVHALGVVRAPGHYNDTRVLRPPQSLIDSTQASLTEKLYDLGSERPSAAAANQVLIRHELGWWKREPTHASPVFTGLPVGLRGMLASWRVARKAPSY